MPLASSSESIPQVSGLARAGLVMAWVLIGGVVPAGTAAAVVVADVVAAAGGRIAILAEPVSRIAGAAGIVVDATVVTFDAVNLSGSASFSSSSPPLRNSNLMTSAS